MYGTLLDVVMQPNKPYAFVTYADVSSAKLAFSEVNGCMQSLSCGEVTFYINYVKQGKLSYSVYRKISNRTPLII